MKNNLLLSIIIPVYNVSDYLPECLNKLIGQIDSRCEIILVNDGSTDGSDIICNDYIKMYKERTILMINQENKGLSGARNSGIRKAKGEYIVFLDSDDFLAEDAIYTLIKYISKNRPDIFLIRSKSFEDGSSSFKEEQINYEKIKDYRKPIEVFKKLNDNNEFWFAAWLIIAKREFIIQESLYFLERIYHEDELWVPVVFSKAKSLELINICLYCYRNNRKGSIINHTNIKKQFDLMIIMEELNRIANTLDKYTATVLKERCAAIEWGRILDYNRFIILDTDAKLLYRIRKNIACLKVRKYIFAYIILKVLGVKKICKLIGIVKNHRGKSDD